MIVGIGVSNATAAWGDVIETAFEQGLQKGQERSRLRSLLGFDQLLRGSKLVRQK